MSPPRPLLLLCLLVLGCTRPSRVEPSTRPDANAPSPAAAQAAECTSDTDCGLTLVREDECCPMLCTPRGVTARQAQALAQRAQECEQRQPCAVPMCPPPRRQPVAVCEAGRCAVRHVDLETR